MDIKPYKKNAKKHPDSQLLRIANSIKRFGWQQPIVVNEEGVIIVGHGRYQAYKKFGKDLELPEPEIKVASLSEEEQKAYRLADNKLNESDWDMDLAVEDLKELSQDLFDITGFNPNLLIEPDEQDDVIPEDPPAIAKIGDIWKLGSHRVMCGDSTSPEAVLRLTEGLKADMVFTDPPYNVNYSGSGKNTSNKILNDNMGDGQFDDFLTKTFERFAEASKDGTPWYVFHSHTTQDQFRTAIEKTGWSVKTQLIWNKPSAGMGMNEYRAKHEPFYYCVKGDAPFYGDRTGTSVWDFQKSDQQLVNWAKKQKKLEQEGRTTIWTMRRDSVSEYVHPTQKPVELITYAIGNSSKAGDTVLDLFLGSGSTLIACEKTNRACFGMELDPRYVDTIIERWQNYTGNKAEKVA